MAAMTLGARAELEMPEIGIRESHPVQQSAAPERATREAATLEPGTLDVGTLDAGTLEPGTGPEGLPLGGETAPAATPAAGLAVHAGVASMPGVGGLLETEVAA
jgi:hypothetical protein